jgi:lipopolysaccharide assembly outer membrane protein LptD (OstA)
VRIHALLLSCFVCLSTAMTAVAQQAEQPRTEPQPQPAPGNSIADRLNSKQNKFEILSATHLRYSGGVEQELGETKISADQVDVYLDTNRLVASGNVVFSTPEGRLAAERVDYNLQTGLGLFETATGLMSLGDKADRRQFGNQEADVYFFGETIEKLGPRRYRISKGGFTTCVQPTPRWEFTSTTMDLNLNDYALVRNSVLKVKGVPVIYLPVIYYPIREDERATGFLLPTYGTSTVRGQAISNAFFWAINRSQDMTVFHDWFSQTGQGAGTEYRYVASELSNGSFRYYRFFQNQTEFTEDGETGTLPENSSFEIVGAASHAFSRAVRGRVRLDYFSDIASQQLYHQNIYQATRHSRVIEAGVTAALGRLSTSVLYQRNEIFNTTTSTQVYGSTPRVTASLAPQRLFNSPVYTSVNSEFAFLPYRVVTDGEVVSDSGYSRFDVAPTVRVPLSRLTFLSVNTSAAYRATYYSRSAELSSSSLATNDEPYTRQYMTVRSDIIGPVLSRIWDLQSGFAERMKHVIEPAFTVDFTSRIEDYTRTPVLGSDSSDFVVSGTTRLTYGLTNRLFSRGRTVDGVRGTTRELMTIGLQQTYYSNPLSGGFDCTYQSQCGSRIPVDLSPLTLTARVSPSTVLDTNARIEFDTSRGRGLQLVSVGNTLNLTGISVGTNYSHSSINPTSPQNFITMTTSMRWLGDRATGNYNVQWDIARSSIVSQSVMTSYLAQCCGLQLEFQKYNYAEVNPGFPSSDTRFNFGFVLAGLGTFSNFFGAFGAGQR